MSTKSERARAKLAELEKNPKHTTETDETKRQTKNDDLDDPKFQNKNPSSNPHKDDPHIDATWKKDKNGTWYIEDGE